jgi:hypothetical protein
MVVILLFLDRLGDGHRWMDIQEAQLFGYRPFQLLNSFYIFSSVKIPVTIR